MIEILVVMVIFMVLASLLFGAIFRARKKALQANCISNLKNIGEAIHVYSIDNSERFPYIDASSTGKETLALLHNLEYIHNENLYVCPAGNGTGATDSDYRYAPGYTENSSPSLALACDDDAEQHIDPRPVTVLYIRGSVQTEVDMPAGPVE